MSTTLSGNLVSQLSFAYAEPATGLNELGVQVNDSKRLQFSTGNSTPLGANRIFGDIVSIAGGGNVTYNLQSLVDQLNLDLAFVRVKGVYLHLVSEDDNADIGTNATSVLFGGANVSANVALAGNASYGMFADSSDRARIFNGGFLTFGTPNAAGLLIDSSHKNVFIENEDPSVTAKVYIGLIGADA